MLSLSTSWNFRRHTSAATILNEIRELGIARVELNFNLPYRVADEFARLQKQGAVEIVSLHNYCPIPDDADPREFSPDDPCLSSCDEAERQRAVQQTKQTIDFAQRLQAGTVVMHLGKVGVKDKTVRLSRLDMKDQAFRELKQAMVEERSRTAAPHIQSVIKSLEELEPYARKRGIRLGIETRYYYREIPSLAEIGILFDHFGGSSIYYWHDVGHAQVWENLGFIKHEDYLARYRERLIGIHLHDIIGITDHQAPGQGVFDFTRLLPYVQSETHLVIEAHQPVTADELAKGIKLIKTIFRSK